jgi:hypothetical protein
LQFFNQLEEQIVHKISDRSAAPRDLFDVALENAQLSDLLKIAVPGMVLWID